MMYKIICSESLRFKRTILIYFIIISYLVTFSSCTTTESLTISPDSLNSENSDEIAKINLKNGKHIDCANKLVEFIKRSDSTVVFSIHPLVSRENTGSFSNDRFIPLNDILSVQLDNIETDIPMTVLIVSGALLVIVGLTALAAYSFSFGK